MKKMTLLLAGGLISASAFSQLLVPIPIEVIVANSGVFEFTPPYSDHATVGTYDIQSGNYMTFDTIYVESVQDISVIHSINGNGTSIYVAAQDSIVMYDGLHQRQNVVNFPSIRSVRATGNKVIAGRWFGSGDYVGVYDQSLNLEFGISDADIPYTVHDAAIVGDSLYVAYNFPSVIDACPPYGCYGDSLGMLGVISLSSQSYVRSVNLGTAGAGIRSLHLVQNQIMAVCDGTGSGKVLTYDPVTQTVTSQNTAVTAVLNDFDFLGEFAFMDTLGVTEGSSAGLNVTNISSTAINAGAYDFEMGDFFYSETDFATYGRLFRKNAADVIIDSVEVDISPDAIALRYDIVGNTSDHEIEASIYPNPSNGRVRVESLDLQAIEVLSAVGQLVQSHQNISSSTFDLAITEEGIYFVRIKTSHGESTRKLIVR